MTELFTAIGNFGFPIVVSIFLLWRFENKLEKLTDVIQQNSEITKDLIRAVEDLRTGVRANTKRRI